jgi:hypothetical protein
MTDQQAPTLCPRCGGLDKHCECADLRREGMEMAAAAVESMVQQAADQLGPLDTGGQVGVRLMLACATRIRAMAQKPDRRL